MILIGQEKIAMIAQKHMGRVERGLRLAKASSVPDCVHSDNSVGDVAR
jgi:hypothetical protein